MSIEAKLSQASRNLVTLHRHVTEIEAGTFVDPARRYPIDKTSFESELAGAERQAKYHNTLTTVAIPRLEEYIIPNLENKIEARNKARERIEALPETTPSALKDSLIKRFEKEFDEPLYFVAETPRATVQPRRPNVMGTNLPHLRAETNDGEVHPELTRLRNMETRLRERLVASSRTSEPLHITRQKRSSGNEIWTFQDGERITLSEIAATIAEYIAEHPQATSKDIAGYLLELEFVISEDAVKRKMKEKNLARVLDLLNEAQTFDIKSV